MHIWVCVGGLPKPLFTVCSNKNQPLARCKPRLEALAQVVIHGRMQEVLMEDDSSLESILLKQGEM